MRIKISRLLNSALIVIALCITANSLITQDSIRFAHIQWPIDQPLPSQFLMRAKNANYNYIMVEYSLVAVPFNGDFNPATGRLNRPSKLMSRMAQHFMQVDSAGLRLIPKIGFGGRWDGDNLLAVRSTIPQQVYHQTLPDSHATISKFGKQLTYDPTNALKNNAVDTILMVIDSAFQRAKPKLKYKALDFINAGFDEWESFGFTYNSKKVHMLMVGVCGADTTWLKTNGLRDSTTACQIRRLVAADMVKRCKQIDKRWKLKTKMMAWYPNIFNDQTFGGVGYSYKRLFDPGLLSNNINYNAPDSIIRVNTSSGLFLPQLTALRDSIVFICWQESAGSVGGINSRASFERMKRNYRFVFVASGDYDESTCSTPFYSSSRKGWLQGAKENSFIVRESEFNGYALGRGAVHWVPFYEIVNNIKCGPYIWDNSKDYIKVFDMMEILAKYNTPNVLKLLK
jgi:hypothetical protein